MDWKKFSLNLLFCFLFSFLITKFYADSKNSIKASQKWTTFKGQMLNPLNGPINYYNDRNNLHKNHLKLNTHFGNDGIISLQKFEWDKLSFRANINPESLFYIYLTYDIKSDVIRIGNNPNYKSSFLTIYDTGLFDKSEAINIDLKPNLWHEISIEKYNGKYLLKIADKTYTVGDISQKGSNYFGFKAHFNRAVIDDIKLFKNKTQLVFQDDFSNKKSEAKIFPFIFTINILIMIICYLFIINGKIHQSNYIFVISIFSIFLIPTYFYDYYYWSKSFSIRNDKLFTIEKMRRRFFFNHISLDDNNNYINYPESLWDFNTPYDCDIFTKEENTDSPHYIYTCNKEIISSNYNMLFLGTSQMFGAGAFNIKTSFFAQVVSAIGKEFLKKSKVRAHLFAKHGKTSKFLLDGLKAKKAEIKDIDIIIINLSFNDLGLDRYEKHYKENIKNLINYLKETFNAPIIFFMEPYNKEAVDMPEYPSFVEEFKSMPQISFYHYMDEPNDLFNDKGIVWWDRIHLTQYGQNMYANYKLNILLNNHLN